MLPGIGCEQSIKGCSVALAERLLHHSAKNLRVMLLAADGRQGMVRRPVREMAGEHPGGGPASSARSRTPEAAAAACAIRVPIAYTLRENPLSE